MIATVVKARLSLTRASAADSASAVASAATAPIASAAAAAMTAGLTVTGAAVNLNASSNFAVNVATGTSTGTVTIGGATGAQALVLASGTGDITMTSTDDFIWTATDDITLNGGSAGSVINIGTNTQGNVIHIGDNDTTADTITIGSAKDTSALAGIAVTVGSTGTTSALTLQSGTGDVTATSTDDISITATDDLALNGGSAGSIITLGGNTHGNVISIGADDTTADTITVGSAKDTTSVAGIAVTVGSTGTTSALTLQSGTGDVTITSTDDMAITATDNITITEASRGTAGTGVAAASEVGVIVTDTLTFTLTGANDIDVDDGGKTKGTLIYTFPEGRILLLGAVLDASIVTNNVYNANPNDEYYVSVGSVDGTQAADADLTSTEQDIIPKTTLDTVGNTALTLDAHGGMATLAAANNIFDGTTTAETIFLNVAVPDANNTGATTHAVTGTLKLTYVNLGDY